MVFYNLVVTILLKKMGKNKNEDDTFMRKKQKENKTILQ